MKNPKIPAKMYKNNFHSKCSSALDVVEIIIVVNTLFVVLVTLLEVVEPFVVDWLVVVISGITVLVVSWAVVTVGGADDVALLVVVEIVVGEIVGIDFVGGKIFVVGNISVEATGDVFNAVVVKIVVKSVADVEVSENVVLRVSEVELVVIVVVFVVVVVGGVVVDGNNVVVVVGVQ